MNIPYAEAASVIGVATGAMGHHITFFLYL